MPCSQSSHIISSSYSALCSFLPAPLDSDTESTRALDGNPLKKPRAKICDRASRSASCPHSRHFFIAIRTHTTVSLQQPFRRESDTRAPKATACEFPLKSVTLLRDGIHRPPHHAIQQTHRNKRMLSATDGKKKRERRNVERAGGYSPMILTRARFLRRPSSS